jgi:hypothetical protein
MTGWKRTSLQPYGLGLQGVASSGNVTEEEWVEYIKSQAPLEPDDNFSVT